MLNCKYGTLRDRKASNPSSKATIATAQSFFLSIASSGNFFLIKKIIVPELRLMDGGSQRARSI
jgi:hypothetical protein